MKSEDGERKNEIKGKKRHRKKEIRSEKEKDRAEHVIQK